MNILSRDSGRLGSALNQGFYSKSGLLPSARNRGDSPYTFQVIKSLRDFIQRSYAAQKRKFLYDQVTQDRNDS